MKVKEIMTQNVTSLTPDDTVQHAAQLMEQFNVGSIPVCNDQKIIGIVTDRDITLRVVAQGEDAAKSKVREIMTSNPAVGKPDMDIHEAARIMSERQIRRLPVVEENNNSIIGIVSLGDIAVEPKLEDDAEKALTDISEPNTPSM